MIKDMINRISGSDDEPIEFNTRYAKATQEKIKERRKHYRNRHIFQDYLKENERIIKELNKSDRPKAMHYFDNLFTTDKVVKEITALKKKGTKVVGTICNLIPEELIYAAGAYPVRLCSGCFESLTPGEDAFPRDSCPLIKSSVGFAVADEPFFSLCDAVVIPATCDGKKKLGEFLNDYVPVWMMDIPQTKDRTTGKKYWLSETRILKKRLEDLTGRTINKRRLREAIETLHSRYDAVRTLMDIRKGTMSRISGTDSFLVMQAAFFDDIERWTRKTQKLCDELEHREGAESKGVRILLTGAPTIMPNFKIPIIIERFGGVIAVDETCAGTQYLYDPVVVDEWTMYDMLRAVSERYYMPSACPCFVKSEDRMDKIVDMIKEFRIDGVIYHTLRLCILFDVESRKIKDIMEEMGMPFLNLNTDYTREDEGQLQTRIEAFIEILQSRR